MASRFQGGDKILRSLKQYRETATGKGRKRLGFFILEGFRAVLQVIAIRPDSVEELLIDERVEDISAYSGFPLRRLNASQLRSITTSTTPQGVVAIIRIPPESLTEKMPSSPGHRIVALENVQDPGNCGTIIRTAAAFDFNGVLLSTQCADPFSPKVVQATAGYVLIPWIRRIGAFVDSVAMLKRGGYRVYCADIRGTEKVNFAGIPRMVLVLGNEGAGISKELRELADVLFAVPMGGGRQVESLNVAVCGAISLFAAFRGGGW